MWLGVCFAFAQPLSTAHLQIKLTVDGCFVARRLPESLSLLKLTAGSRYFWSASPLNLFWFSGSSGGRRRCWPETRPEIERRAALCHNQFARGRTFIRRRRRCLSRWAKYLTSESACRARRQRSRRAVRRAVATRTGSRRGGFAASSSRIQTMRNYEIMISSNINLAAVGTLFIFVMTFTPGATPCGLHLRVFQGSQLASLQKELRDTYAPFRSWHLTAFRAWHWLSMDEWSWVFVKSCYMFLTST